MLAVSAAVLLLCGGIATFLALRFQPLARESVLSALRLRYGGTVSLGDLRTSLFPSVRITGENLEIRPAGRTDLPPMIRVRRFILDANFVAFFRTPRRIALIRLDGLEIQTPPRTAAAPSVPAAGAAPVQAAHPVFPFVLEQIVADQAILRTTPSDPAKDPLVFQIRELTMYSLGPGQAMTFHAKVENAKPPGLIHTDGQFGPWNTAQPSETPLSGDYTFRDADLGVFRGISGTLSSDGKYRGRLLQLEVHGTTDVPNFALDMGDHPMRLQTEFDATVDGTNGNTVLHPVTASLGNSRFEVLGTVARNALEKNKEIILDAKGSNTRLEDFLRLTMKGPKQPMTGRLAFNTHIRVPPGQISVWDRIDLDGSFSLTNAQFTSPDVQSKIASLSHHAQGNPKDTDPNVAAAFSGAFRLRKSELALPKLAFELPGAHVTLAGTYGLRSGVIDFTGTARLDATVSHMTTGIKSLLLKPLDPLFRRDGAGTVAPIRIKGTRGSPAFSIDFGRLLQRK